VGRRLGAQDGRRPRVLAELPVRLREPFHGGDAQLFEGERGGFQGCAAHGAGECGALPEGKGLAQHLDGVGGPVLEPGEGDQFLEAVGVEEGFRELERVGGALGGEPDPVHLGVVRGEQGP
jgi:hypothetical protein